jgi:tetratricopeptide (TPR) repeat protein
MSAAEKVLSIEPAYARVDLVTALRDKSLLYVKPDAGGAPRLALYETVREFALEKLADGPTANPILARHDAYFLDVGARLSRRVDKTGDIHARELLARDYDNLLEVHARSVVRASTDAGAARVAVAALLAADAVMSTQASAEVRARLWEGTWAAAKGAPLSADLLIRAQGALGRALAARGDHDAAIDALRAAVAEAQAAGEAGLEPSLWVDLGVALHADRKLEEARAAYLAAVSADRKMTDPRSRARALGNLGALDHDERKPAAARKSYERSVELASGVSDPRIEGIMLTNLAVLDQEEGALGVASTRYERAVRLLEQAQDLRLLAITWGNFGMLLAEKGDTDAARAAEERAIGLLGAIGDHRSLGLAHARLAAMLALSGDRERATTHVAESRAAFQSASDELGLDIARVAEAFLEIGGGPAAHERARLLLADAPKSSDDARALSRLLERALSPTAQAPSEAPLAPDALGVGPRFASYRPPRGEIVSIEDHRAAHQVFGRLVEWRRHRPGEGLDTAALTEAGWPGEKMRVEAARNRLYVVIAWLRKQGLDGILLRRPQGYLLDPEVPIELRERLGRD